MFFFHFYKNIKNIQKTLNCSIHSSKKNLQYESNKVNNTATKHSLCPGNGVCLTLARPTTIYGKNIAEEKCIIFVILYVYVLTTTKT